MEGTNLWTFLVLFHLLFVPGLNLSLPGLNEPKKVILTGNTVYEEELVSLTCDADVARVPPTIKSISSIDISRRVPSEGMKETIFVLYRSYGPKRLYSNLPPGRNWEYRYGGGNNLTDTRDMVVTLHLLDTTVADAGFYRCSVTVMDVDGFDEVFGSEQELKVIKGNLLYHIMKRLRESLRKSFLLENEGHDNIAFGLKNK